MQRLPVCPPARGPSTASLHSPYTSSPLYSYPCRLSAAGLEASPTLNVLTHVPLGPTTLLCRGMRNMLRGEEGTDLKLIKDVIPNIFRVFISKVVSFRLRPLFNEKISLKHQISSHLVSYPFGKIGKNAGLKREPCPCKYPKCALLLGLRSQK